MYFLAKEKIFCQDKKYFVQADGRGINAYRNSTLTDDSFTLLRGAGAGGAIVTPIFLEVCKILTTQYF